MYPPYFGYSNVTCLTPLSNLYQLYLLRVAFYTWDYVINAFLKLKITLNVYIYPLPLGPHSHLPPQKKNIKNV